VGFRRDDGRFGAIVPSGTRDPVFFANYAKIKAAVIKLIEDEFPEALKDATYRIIDADATASAILVRTVDRDPAKLAARHEAELARNRALATPKPGSLFSLDAQDAHEWTLYNLLQNEEVIRNVMFPITYYAANGTNWVQTGTARPRYGTFIVDTCNAIKITIDRPDISASVDEHDVFGAQQQNAIETLCVPVFAQALARASSF